MGKELVSSVCNKDCSLCVHEIELLTDKTLREDCVKKGNFYSPKSKPLMGFEDRDSAVKVLVEHLIEMCAANCEIPFMVEGEKYTVTVNCPAKNPIGMYGETPRVKIGKYTICRQDDKSVWIEVEGDEGGQFSDESFEKTIAEYFNKNF